MDFERQIFPAEHDAIAFSDDDSTLGDIEVLVAFEILEIFALSKDYDLSAEMIPVPMDYYNYLYRHGRIYPSQYGMYIYFLRHK